MRIEIQLSADERRRLGAAGDTFRETLLSDLGIVVAGRIGARLRVLNERRMPLLAWDYGEPWPPIFKGDRETLLCKACKKRHVDRTEAMSQPHYWHTCVDDEDGPGCGERWTEGRLVLGQAAEVRR